MHERRRDLRAQTCLAGRAAFEQGSSVTVDCVVQAFSTGGARVLFPTETTVPKHFDLFVGQSSRPHRARVMWRHTSEVGVTFLEGRAAPEVMPG
ncbi:PilZ domain-containing protein [Methylobacterium nigriterrae]|uniref:PilZ domain-containing protein n=1 Tax=Methylobacterium nigriterrae TaxID=3127512 RepID=UPI003D666B0D